MVSDLLDDLLNEDAWYEVKDESSSPIDEGKYTATVTGLNVKDNKEVQGKFLADIFEPVFKINGVDVKHKGLFRFKKPDPSLYPHLQEDMGSNSGYYAFMNMCKLTQEKDGKMLLPPLTLDMLNTMTFEVEVVIESWTGRNGNEMKTPRVVKVLSVKKTVPKRVGLPQEVEEDELPF
jgi:hypothetical protein